MGKKGPYTKPVRTFGPIVWQDNETKEIQIRCQSGSHYCFRLVGSTCLDHKPHKAIESVRDTPGWCRFMEQALNDAKELIEEGK